MRKLTEAHTSVLHTESIGVWGEPPELKHLSRARDTLRLEMGFCLYGNDLSDTTSPLEAGLGTFRLVYGELREQELPKKK